MSPTQEQPPAEAPSGPVGGADRDAVRTRPPLLARIVIAVVGAVIGLFVLGAVGFVVFLPLLSVAAVLVPAGVVYGITIRIVLVVRRRRAAARVPGLALPVEGERRRGAQFRFGTQVADLWLNRVLLGLLAPVLGLVVFVVLGASGTDVRIDEGPWTALIPVELAIVTALLAAIPVSAAFTTRLAAGTALLDGEAVALATGAGAARRIRTARTLSWVVAGAYGAIALAVCVATTVVAG